MMRMETISHLSSLLLSFMLGLYIIVELSLNLEEVEGQGVALFNLNINEKS